MQDRILVFIPCYNCSRQIGRVLAQFRDVAPGLFAKIMVVDNESRDDTAGAATRAMHQVTGCPVEVARNRENYNLGGSHKAVFSHALAAGYTHVVVLHGDDQGDIRDLLPIIAKGEHRSQDAWLGSRFMRGSRLEGYSTFRTLGNRAFNLLFSLVSRRRVSDLGSGLNLFARSVFGESWVLRCADDLRFNIYLLLGCVDHGLKLRFFPISWREDDQVSNVKLVSQATRTLVIAAEYLFVRGRFRRRDHRALPRDRYEFDVVAAHFPALQPG